MRQLVNFPAWFAIVAASAVLAQNPAVTPVDRLNQPWWARKHAMILEQVKANPNIGLVLLGDSITQNYEKANPPDENFQPTWQRFYAPRGALNAGFSGDRTEHVLWRLDHGELDGIHPRALLLLIGTNNTGAGHTAAQTEAGIDAVVDKLREKLPKTEILLLGICRARSRNKSRRRISPSIATCRRSTRVIPRSATST